MLELEIDTRVQCDATKPVGEACNGDGTLKDASEMNWLNSPSDEMPPPFSKRARSLDLDAQFIEGNTKRSRVCENLFVAK